MMILYNQFYDTMAHLIFIKATTLQFSFYVFGMVAGGWNGFGSGPRMHHLFQGF